MTSFRGRALQDLERAHVAKGIARAAFIAAGLLVLAGCTQQSRPAQAPQEVTVIEVAPKPITLHTDYVGQTQAPDTIEIRAQVTGLLERQAFVDGERVKKGDLLYVIDQRPFLAQVAQAKAALSQAESNQVNAKQNLERNERLIAEKAVSQADYDSAVALEHAAVANVAAQGALLRNAELNLEFATVHAPRDGYMSRSGVKPGALITAQQTLLSTLYSSDPMWVYFSLSEDRALELRKAHRRPDKSTPFRITLADGAEYAIAGQLDFVDAAIDSKSATLQVRLSVPNPDRVLRPGLFVRVSVPILDVTEAIRVPQQAVQELQGRRSVYVVATDDKVQARQIVAEFRIGSDWVVSGGLTAGERVVVEGISKIRPGSAVKPVPLAATKS